MKREKRETVSLTVPQLICGEIDSAGRMSQSKEESPLRARLVK